MHQKQKIPRGPRDYRGGNTGTRTLDPMIKSHLLYQLSYVPKTELEKGQLEKGRKRHHFQSPAVILTYKK